MESQQQLTKLHLLDTNLLNPAITVVNQTTRQVIVITSRQFIVVRKRDILQKFVITGPQLIHSLQLESSGKTSQHILWKTLLTLSEYSLFTVNNYVHGKGTDSNLFTVNVLINKQPVGMQIDTGAVVSIMSENNFGPR